MHFYVIMKQQNQELEEITVKINFSQGKFVLAPHTSKSFAFRCQEFAGSSSMEDYYDKTYLYVYI